MLKHTTQTEARIRNFLSRIEALIYDQTTPLDVSIWEVKGEPVAPSTGMQADYTPFSVGGYWGGLWDTAWFRFRGTVPESWKGREVVALVRYFRIGQPGLREGFTVEGLVFQDGKPSRALNANRLEVDISCPADGGESFEFFVEAAANGGTNQEGVTEGLVLPDYDGPPGFQLHRAELACVNRKAFDFYYDFKVALEAMEVLPANSQRRAELRYALNEAVNNLDVEVPATIDVASSILAPVLSKRNGDTVHTVSAVGHAHIDTAWLWPLRETIRKCARTFATALDYMERYPEYVFVCSQAQQYAWMKAYYPDIWDGIKKAVQRGQWEPVGSMWIETDCNLVSGESLIRQILVGKRFFQKELGYTTRDVWIPDVFGYSASLPQIMKRSGIEYFLTQKISWSQFNKFPHQTFLWEGIDGSRIFTHFPPADTYNADPGPKDLTVNTQNFMEHGRATRSLLVYGWGDGGGGPSIEMLEKCRRMENLDGFPKVQPEKAITFFEKASEDAKDLPLWIGELYLELHRGTYTSQAKNKLGNRKSEFLLRDAEFFDALSLALVPDRIQQAADPERAVYDVTGLGEHGVETHRFALERAWNLVLLNQFHDIIPGSSINWVYRDSDRDYQTVSQLGSSVRDSSLIALEREIDTSDLSNPVVIWNTLNFSRDEVIQLSDGSLTQIQVPACGYTVVDGSDPEKSPSKNDVEVTVRGKDIVLNNGLIRLELNDRGQIVSIFDLRANRESLAPGEHGNIFHLHEDIPNNWDAWDVDVFYKEKFLVIDGLESMELIEQGSLRAVVRIKRVFGRSSLVQDIILRRGSARVDFSTKVDWQEEHKMLKVGFPVNVHSHRATYEIQYGRVERPTHTNTSWDLARFEVCAQKWADLSEPGFGVALLNDCKYGYDVLGHTLRLSLLRAPTSPDPKADRGMHEFTYALLPHVGDIREGQVLEEAYALNAPLLVRATGSHPGKLPKNLSFFHIDRAGLIIEAMKESADGGSIIVRLYEAEGARGTASISTYLPFKRAALTNLLEEEESNLPSSQGSLTFQFKPFEIITLKFCL